MPLLSTIGAAAARAFGFLRSLVAGGYNVSNSLRFNSGSSDRLNRTSSSQTAQKFTFSCWFKLSSNFTGRRNLFATDYSTNASTSGQSGMSINVWQDSTILSGGYGGSVQIVSTALFRDPGAWYHLVWAVDTTQATASNRLRIYINGSEITSFSQNAYPPQNQNIEYKNHSIGSYSDQATYGSSPNYTYFFDGYQSECYLIDGQQLTPSSFGETDETTGIWKPKAYTGTYGTNGFYLKFANSASLGTDSSGNGNNFTVTNLTSVDQSTDTPTNNFCTLNFIQNGDNSTSVLTEGNLVAGTADNRGVAANFGVNKGKWYWEVKTVGSSISQYVGVSNRANEQNGDSSPGVNSASVRSFCGNTTFKNYTSSSGTSNSSFVNTNGAIYGLALDLDAGTLGRYVNGTLINTDTTLPSDNSVTFFPMAITTFSGSGGWNSAQFNFGSPMYAANSYADANGFGNFSYAVPSGYYSLCTKNLADFG